MIRENFQEMKKFLSSLIGILFAALIIGMNMMPADTNNQRNIASNKIEKITEAKEDKEIEDTSIDESTEADKETASNLKEKSKKETSAVITEDIFSGYKLIVVDGGNLSGYREPNVVVDIGFGDREYYAFINEYGQLVKVMAKEILLQDDSTEPVNSSGRYYPDEAKVPGVESKTLDQRHVIADSLGGVSNAYNITPQNSILNKHGDQAYMEKVIRDAGGCTELLQ